MTQALQDPFLHGYENETVNDLIVTMKVAAEKQKVHPAFQGMLAEYVTPPDKMAALTGSLESARDEASLSSDVVKAAQLDAVIAACVKALRFNAQHVNLVANHRNDPSLRLEAGYLLKPHPVAKVKVNLLDQVPELEAKLGPVEGSVIVVVKKRPIRAGLELQMTDNPADERSWRPTAEGTYNSSRIDLRDLESVKRIYFRARYHEDGAVGHWSSPISIIVH